MTKRSAQSCIVITSKMSGHQKRVPMQILRFLTERVKHLSNRFFLPRRPHHGVTNSGLIEGCPFPCYGIGKMIFPIISRCTGRIVIVRVLKPFPSEPLTTCQIWRWLLEGFSNVLDTNIHTYIYTYIHCVL
jgi:hypothetical protein